MKTIKRILQGDGGFTLIEFLAVMAIVATLAGIVSTSVSGSNEASKVAAAKQDASTTTSTVGAYFADHQAAEVLETLNVTVTALFDDKAAGDVVATEQKFGNRWPERNITEDLANEGDATTSPYTNEFPTANSATNGKVVNISILGTADAHVHAGSADADTYACTTYGYAGATYHHAYGHTGAADANSCTNSICMG